MTTNNHPNQHLNPHYSQHARRVLTRARVLAKQHAHEGVDSTHVLIAILHETGSIGCNVLHDIHMDLQDTERAFKKLTNDKLNASINLRSTSLPYTEALQAALNLAGDESRWLGQHYIGTEHLLLGLARSNEAQLIALLHSLDISPEQIRRRVRRLLQEGISEISIEQAKRFARLSELSRRVLNGAEQIAAQMGHSQVGLAHLLLALARERRSVCAQLLREAKLDEKALEANLIKARPAMGGRLEDVIDRAVDRAESFGSHYTGTDHLLLTIATEPRGVRLLRKYSADPQYLVESLWGILAK